MKRLPALLLAMVLVACGTRPQQPAAHPDWSYNSVVYEMNVRQYTPEGTLTAAARELPRLRELGVDVVWLMPVYPIGVKERKGTLGSYYAISDYEAVNPEFGTLEDFDRFVADAHRLGLRVILDWVANHTSPDARWIEEHPADWYVRDSLGNTIVQYDWTDIAKLDYGNTDMRAAMAAAMRFWLNRGIDGFRCDMACEVPIDFWQQTLPALRKEYPGIYLLAEGEAPALHDGAFDASYAWELHHLLNDIAQGRKSAADLRAYVARDSAAMPREAFRLMFTSNHDENSWAGTEFERMGDTGTQKRRRPACLRRQRLRCHAARGVPPDVHLEPRRKLVGRDGIRAHGRRSTRDGVADLHAAQRAAARLYRTGDGVRPPLRVLRERPRTRVGT